MLCDRHDWFLVDMSRNVDPLAVLVDQRWGVCIRVLSYEIRPATIQHAWCYIASKFIASIFQTLKHSVFRVVEQVLNSGMVLRSSGCIGAAWLLYCRHSLLYNCFCTAVIL
jgi:hypothetical protein